MRRTEGASKELAEKNCQTQRNYLSDPPERELIQGNQ